MKGWEMAGFPGLSTFLCLCLNREDETFCGRCPRPTIPCIWAICTSRLDRGVGQAAELPRKQGHKASAISCRRVEDSASWFRVGLRRSSCVMCRKLTDLSTKRSYGCSSSLYSTQDTAMTTDFFAFPSRRDPAVSIQHFLTRAGPVWVLSRAQNAELGTV